MVPIVFGVWLAAWLDFVCFDGVLCLVSGSVDVRDLYIRKCLEGIMQGRCRWIVLAKGRGGLLADTQLCCPTSWLC